MKHTADENTLKWKCLVSICASSLITAVGYLTEDQRMELLTLPGLIINMTFNWVMLAIPTGDEFYSLPAASHVVFNLAFYTTMIFAALILIPLIIESMKDDRILKAKGSECRFG
ncbi:MAG: hypothetical protein ND895_03350 [Pyrinomonadaceae bacterium]|nr:hypothetical protein [Pyrinomonadaceae bacterium]